MPGFSVEAAGNAFAQNAPLQRIGNALTGRRQASALNTTRALTDIDYLDARAQEALALAHKHGVEASQLTAASQPLTDPVLATVGALGAGTTEDLAGSFLHQQRGEPGPWRPVPEDVGSRLGKVLYGIQASRLLPGKTNFQELTAGQGNLQNQDITNQALAAADEGTPAGRTRLVQRLEILKHEPELLKNTPEGVFNTATGALNEQGGLTQAKIGAYDALANYRDQAGDAATTRAGKGPNMGKIAQVEHLMQTRDMSFEDAVDVVKSLTMKEGPDREAQLRLKLRELAAKGTFSRKKADEMYQQLLTEFGLADKPGQATQPPGPWRADYGGTRELNRAPQASAPAPAPEAKPADLTDAEWSRLQELRKKYPKANAGGK